MWVETHDRYGHAQIRWSQRQMMDQREVQQDVLSQQVQQLVTHLHLTHMRRTEERLFMLLL